MDLTLASAPAPTIDAAALTSLVMAPDVVDALRSHWDQVEVDIPELGALAMPGGYGLHKDTVDHTIVVTAKTPARLRVRLCALFHDVGKPLTRRIEGSQVTFWQHEQVGARLSAKVLRRLGYDDTVVAEVSRMVELSGAAKDSPVWSDAAVRRFSAGAGQLCADLLAFYRCDVTSRQAWRHQQVQADVDHLEARIAEVAQLDAERARRPVLDGNTVMAHYDLAPGPQVGKLLRLLLDAQQDGRVADEDEAWALLDAELGR